MIAIAGDFAKSPSCLGSVCMRLFGIFAVSIFTIQIQDFRKIIQFHYQSRSCLLLFARKRDRILSGSAELHPQTLVSWRQDKPEPQVVVAVAWRVPVPVRRPRVPGVVVPAAAANHAVCALGLAQK